MESSERPVATGIVNGVTDAYGNYEGGITFVRPGGQYTGKVEVTFAAEFPELDPKLVVSVCIPGGGDDWGYVRRDLSPGDLRELAAACQMAADACERARQSKAA